MCIQTARRFLKARNERVEKAVKMYVAQLEWRKEFGADTAIVYPDAKYPVCIRGFGPKLPDGNSDWGHDANGQRVVQCLGGMCFHKVRRTDSSPASWQVPSNIGRHSPLSGRWLKVGSGGSAIFH
jgi:hypothetical protein